MLSAEKKYYPRPLWFWNEKPTEEGIRFLMENCSVKDHYAGFGILPYDACKMEYMGEEYLSIYGFVLEEAKRLGLKICLYDEWWFPSGWAGGILKDKYPEALAKRLDMEEYFSDEKSFRVELPQDGKIMAVVAMKGSDRVDLSSLVDKFTLKWEAPDRNWKVLCFILRESGWNHVDYLSEDAVQKFIECTHEVYYKHFSAYFGNVIDSAFYDEPQFYGAEGRMWTEKFNERFTEKYGKSPAVYYPALFFDIGEETAFARNALLSLRADLYAESFPGTLQKWCTAHGISLTGHVDQEEVENPCGMTGDLMKSFRYQDIPGVDEIMYEGRASAAYKIVSSAAINWNKKAVMCECFGAMNNLTEDAMYRESYDLFTKGVNVFVPHAVWYDDAKEKIIFQPELSFRNNYFGKLIPSYSDYYARVAKFLQESVAVNSVGMLYPIESLQYLYTMNWEGDKYFGGPTNEKNNYMRLGQYICRDLNVDYTFLHPEVLQERCTVQDGTLTMKGTNHIQNFKVIILPGMKAISVKTMEVFKEFVQAGGTLIAVSELPVKACEFNQDEKLVALCEELFGLTQIGTSVHKKTHAGGGKCYSLPFDKKEFLHEIFQESALDTKVLNSVQGLQYIHKQNEKNIWYFANLGKDFNTKILLPKIEELRAWDPKTGEEVNLSCQKQNSGIVIDLSLKANESLIIEEKVC